MRKTIPVDQLNVGMEVVGLDKSWLETNILFHRFRIRSREEIDKLRENGIRMVTINAQTSPQAEEDRSSPELTITDVPDDRASSLREIPPECRNLEVVTVPELREWNTLHKKTIGLLSKSFNEIRMGQVLDAEPLYQQVIETLDMLLKDPRKNSFIVTLSEIDDESYIHSANTMILAMSLAMQSGVEREDLPKWGLSALLHDVGKALIPLEILKKPGKLSPEEWDTMKRHPRLGYSILSKNKNEIVRGLCTKVAIEHHERKGGTGYPYGLDLPVLDPVTRSLMVLDIYEALTAGRVYRSPLSPAKTLTYLLENELNRVDSRAVVDLVHMIGIYPIGSFVELMDGRIALVSDTDDSGQHTLKVLFARRSVPLPEPVTLVFPSIDRSNIRQTFHPRELGLSSSDVARYLDHIGSGDPDAVGEGA